MIDIHGIIDSDTLQVNSLTVSVTLGAIIMFLALWTMVRPSRFPPGPRGLPVVGSIFGLDDSPEIVFSEWAKKYGDIVGFKVGERWIVVLSGHDVVKEATIKQGADFAGRPDFYSLGIFSEGFKDIAFGPFSDTWRLHRKLSHTALRHFATGKPLQNLISDVLPKVERELKATNGKPTNPKSLVGSLMFNVLAKLCLGKSFELNDPIVHYWHEIDDEINEKFGLGLAADIFSWAKYIPSSGIKRTRYLAKSLLDFIRDSIAHRNGTYDPDNINDFYDMLLKAQDDARNEKTDNIDQLTDTHVIQTLNDIFWAGVTTSVETLYWAFALIVEHPSIQSKVRDEIDRVIGRDRVPTINDRGTLPYTEATLYEVLRFSSIVPVGLPHATTRDTEFRGYKIPNGTTVIINLMSLHFDPKAWKAPHSFRPEHFLDVSGTVRQHPQNFLPFGAGRRSCLGEAVAKADLFIIFSWFMQNYTFSKVPGKEEESLINILPKTAAGRHLQPYEIVINERD